MTSNLASFGKFGAVCAQMTGKTPSRPPRLAVRAVMVHENRLLLVNAWKGKSHLWCAPGGGVEPHSSLPDNLTREVWEETGLDIEVGAPCLVNEFHDPEMGFHQVDVYFRCTVKNAQIDPAWRDPEGVVSQRRWVTRSEMTELLVKPDSLADVAWSAGTAPLYDPLELLIR